MRRNVFHNVASSWYTVTNSEREKLTALWYPALGIKNLPLTRIKRAQRGDRADPPHEQGMFQAVIE